MWNFKESMTATLASMKRSVGEMFGDFEQVMDGIPDDKELDKDFKEVLNGKERVTVAEEIRPDGTRVKTTTTVRVTQTPQAPPVPKAEKPPTPSEVYKMLEEVLWKKVYYRVKNCWPDRSTVLLFDDKHYAIGYIDASGKFTAKGTGDSLEMAVKEVERKFDKVSPT